jgi:hypothetical protein
MKRTLVILLAIATALTLAGGLFAVTRSGTVPAKARAFDWRRAIKSAVADHVEALAEEVPA